DEDDRLGFRRIDEARHFAARFFIPDGGPFTQRVDGPVHVGVVFRVVAFDGFDDDARLLRSGRAVQVDQRPPVDHLVKHREIPAYSLHVDHALIFRSIRLMTCWRTDLMGMWSSTVLKKPSTISFFASSSVRPRLRR